jgi:hypothetical protein
MIFFSEQYWQIMATNHMLDALILRGKFHDYAESGELNICQAIIFFKSSIRHFLISYQCVKIACAFEFKSCDHQGI